MTIKCSKCGAEFEGVFCPECGTNAGAVETNKAASPAEINAKIESPSFSETENNDKGKRSRKIKKSYVFIALLIAAAVLYLARLPEGEAEMESRSASVETDETGSNTSYDGYSYLEDLANQDVYDWMSEEEQELYKDDFEAMSLSMEEYCYYALSGMKEHATKDFKLFYDWNYPSDFKKDRKKVFKLFEEVVDGQIVPSTSSDKMIKVKSKVGIKHAFIEFIVSDHSTDDDVYIYYGESKKGVPNGTGILFNENTITPIFAGNFKNGKVKGYGMIFKFGQIKYESEKCTYKGGSEFLASGKTICYVTSADSELYRNVYCKAFEEAGYSSLDMFDMMAIAPEVIYQGQMDNSKRSGKGCSYFELYDSVSSSSEAAGKLFGQLRYDGEWKYDEFHGKGKLYTADGSLKYRGQFRNGKIKN